MTESVNCWVYKSPEKEEMYLYLTEENGFDVVPEPLRQRFGKPELVMALWLHPGRRLAREDVNKVLSNLDRQGFHLQMPPTLRPDAYYGNEA
jgi:uncharacterized protein YcgL (UPF0745 family)